MPFEEDLAQLADTLIADYPGVAGVQLIIAADSYLQQLNSRYRDKDRPTDVLSFSLGGAAVGDSDLSASPTGEIYISIDQAQQQAEAQAVALREEVSRLLVHGLLHLAGFEHRDEAELRLMEQETDKYLQAAGITASLSP